MSHDALNGTLFEGSIKGGTPQLFPSAPLLSDRARYPRGYTPARQAEVRGNGPRVYGPQPTVRRVRDNLARSTVPMGGPLRQTNVYANADFEKNHITGGTTAGEYRPPSDTVSSHSVLLGPGQEDNPVLIHELGHLDSFVSQRGHSSYRTHEAKGAEEAYADDFAVRNFRDRRGRAPSPEGGYTGSVKAGKTDPAFARQYRDSRQTLPDERAQRIAHTEKLLNSHPLLPSGHVPGQLPLLEGDMTGSPEAGDERVKWDYTNEQKDAGVQRDAPHEGYLSPRAAKVRAARLPTGTKVRTKVDWDSGAVR